MVYVLISEENDMCLGVFDTRDKAIEKMLTVVKVVKENLEEEVYDYMPESFIIQYVEMNQPNFVMYSEVYEEWYAANDYDFLYLYNKTKTINVMPTEYAIA